MSTRMNPSWACASRWRPRCLVLVRAAAGVTGRWYGLPLALDTPAHGRGTLSLVWRNDRGGDEELTTLEIFVMEALDAPPPLPEVGGLGPPLSRGAGHGLPCEAAAAPPPAPGPRHTRRPPDPPPPPPNPMRDAIAELLTQHGPEIDRIDERSRAEMQKFEGMIQADPTLAPWPGYPDAPAPPDLARQAHARLVEQYQALVDSGRIPSPELE
jgi:hypothetical protein